MREAELHTGEILEFPDETSDEVIRKVVRRHLGIKDEPSLVDRAVNSYKALPTPEPYSSNTPYTFPDPEGTPALQNKELDDYYSALPGRVGGYLSEKKAQLNAQVDAMNAATKDVGTALQGFGGIAKGALDTGIDLATQAGSGIRHMLKGARINRFGVSSVPSMGTVAQGIRDDTEAVRETITPEGAEQYRKENPAFALGEKVVPGMMTPFTDALELARTKYGDKPADTLEVVLAMSPLGLLMKPKLPKGKGTKPGEKPVADPIAKEFEEFSNEQKAKGEAKNAFEAYDATAKAEAKTRQQEARDRVMDLESRAATDQRIREARAAAEEAERRANYEYMAKSDKEAAAARLEEARARVMELEDKAAQEQRIREARERELDLRENAELEAEGAAYVAKKQFDLNERMNRGSREPIPAELLEKLKKQEPNDFREAIRQQREQERAERYAKEDEINAQIYSPEVAARLKSQRGSIDPSLIEDTLKVAKAVVRLGGKTYESTNHFLAIKEAMADGWKIGNRKPGDSHTLFKLNDGRIVDAAEAQKIGGGKRSEDMVGEFGDKAREVVEMAKAKRDLPYPDVPTEYAGAWRGPKNERGFIDIGQLTTPKDTKTFMWGVHHAMMNTKDKLGRAWDIDNRHGFSTSSWQSMTDMIKNPDNPAFKIANHITESLNAYGALANSIVFNKKDTYKAIREAYHFKITEQADFNRFKKDVAAALKLEKDPESWGGGKGKWSPTAQDMLNAGFDPKSIPTWEKIYALQEHNWTILEATAIMNGVPVPPRIPGQLPHAFRGQYNVIVKLVDTMNDKNVKYYSQYNYHNARDLDKRYAETEKALGGKVLTLEDGRTYRVELERHDATAGGTNIAGELAALWSAADRMQIKPLQKVLDSIFEANEQGMIASALQRNHITMKGHILERLNETGTGGLSMKDARAALLTWERYSDALVDWHVRSRWVNEVLMPMYDAGYFLEAPNLRKFVQAKQAAFFKTPDIWTKPITDIAESMLIKMKLDPHIVNDISNGLTQAMSIFYLTGNIPYYLANINQALLTHSVLLLEKSRIELMTGQKVNLTKAMWDQITQDKATKKSLRESAEQGGYSDPVMVENLAGQSKLQDPAAKRIDQYTRRISYNAAYHMAKQILNDAQAREYAGRVSREVNVPYDPETGAPTAFGRMGALRPLTTFMTYQQHMLGMHRQQFHLMKQGISTGKFDVAGNAALAALSMVGINTLLYGLGGMTGMATYDQIAYWLSKAGYDLPSTKELGRKLDVTLQPYLGKELSKDLTTLGLASKYQLMLMSAGYFGGIDQSGAGSGPTFQVSTALQRMLGIAVDSVLLSSKFAASIFDKSKAPTNMELAEYAKNLPAQHRAVVQWMINNNNASLSDVVKASVPGSTLDKTTYRPNRDPNLRGEPRADARELRTSLIGTPIEQRQGDITEQIIARKTAYYKDKISSLEQRYKEAPFNKKADVLKEFQKLQTETGVDLVAITQAMMEYEADKNKTPTQRVMENLSPTMKSMADYKLRQTIKEQQPQHWKGQR